MKKRDLLKLLDHLSDNDDVYIYNGFVEDYQDIDKNDSTMIDLLKPKKDVIYNNLFCEKAKELGTFDMPDSVLDYLVSESKNIHKKTPFMISTTFTKDVDKYYNKKRVFLLVMKSKDDVYFDRLGEIKY